MKKYLAVFTGSTAAAVAWMALSDSERQQRHAAGIAAWTKWAADNAASIVDIGGHLSRTTLVSRQGISDAGNDLGAYTIVSAESKEAAASLFLNHPHFTIFYGEAVEVMEVLSVPA
ncbi:MAG: hypothetical protein LBE86_09375 [Gemmobacter sp.]|jgi:hypothetical protein|nr:hypothetical protein [Gemmobacter sp.]